MHFYWEESPRLKSNTDDRVKSPVIQTTLWGMFSNEPEYGEGNDTKYLRIGGAYLDHATGKWPTHVGYSMATKKSKAGDYKSQSEAMHLGDFPSLQDAKETIRKAASEYFTKLAKDVLNAK